MTAATPTRSRLALPPTARWMATEPTSVGTLHIGGTDAEWIPNSTGPCTGGMGGSGGWRTRCGLIALPLCRDVDGDEIGRRGTCPDCWGGLRRPSVRAGTRPRKG